MNNDLSFLSKRSSVQLSSPEKSNILKKSTKVSFDSEMMSSKIKSATLGGRKKVFISKKGSISKKLNSGILKGMTAMVANKVGVKLKDKIKGKSKGNVAKKAKVVKSDSEPEEDPALKHKHLLNGQKVIISNC